MRQDQREFLEREFAGLVEQFSEDLDREGQMSPRALLYVASAERVLDWLRGDAQPSRELLPFLRRRLAEADDEMNYPQVLKKVYEHEAIVAAVTELDSGRVLDEHQRFRLLDDWRGRVAILRADADADAHGHLGPGSTQMVEQGTRLVEWLEGGPMPDAATRVFLEEQLDGFKRDSGYDDLIEEHDGIAAAIEELR